MHSRFRRHYRRRFMPVAALAVFLGLACAHVAQAQEPDARAALRQWDSTIGRFQTYLAALNRFGSPSSDEWRHAIRELKTLPEHLWAPDKVFVDAALTSPAARRELHRRGQVYTLGQVFSEEYDAIKWERAWSQLRELGDSAVDYTSELLLRQLLTAHRREAWEPIRYYLIECGDRGRDFTLKMVESLVKDVAEREAAAGGGVVPNASLNQCLQVLIGFGDQTRGRIQALVRDRSPQVRATVAAALGDSRDPALFPALTALAADPEWGVRAAAAEGLGEHRYRRADAARVLSGRLAAESNATVKLKILESMGRLRDPSTIEPMVAALEATEKEWDALMKRMVTERERAGIPEIERQMKAQAMEVLAKKRRQVDPTLIREMQIREGRVQHLVDASMAQKDLMQKLMYALWKVTDARLNTPAKWRAWWTQEKAEGSR